MMHKTKKIAVIGNYAPRQCGIATFTTDLCNALARHIHNADENLIAIAMDDIAEGYDYPERVKFQIRAHVQPDYVRAAEFLNVHKFDVAILQHEFGIYGGKNGAHVMHLMQNLRMPIMTVLHTVLNKPSDGQRIVIQELAKYSEFLVVMAHHAKTLLQDVYGIEGKKITFIPHGIPDVPFERADTFRKELGITDKKVLLTFGLLSPGKGLETMLNAMPGIIAEHPEALYIILGKTHPHVIGESGDSYRQALYQQVRRLKIDKHVLFENSFVDLDTLTQYIRSADVYVTPYVSEDQIVSGTLAYAVGIGAVTVSTPYWYAKEILAEGRGRLVPFADSVAMTKEINDLLDHENIALSMRKKGYQHGRSMIWSKVGQDYIELTDKALARSVDRPIPQYAERPDVRIIKELPDFNLQHMQVMTDDTGILQHAKYSIPDRTHGYCVDDNARALIVVSKYYWLRKEKSVIPLIQIYLSFLHYSFNPENGRFRNFMSYDRRWLEEVGSEDSHGRSLWGLGIAIQCAPNDAIRDMAVGLFLGGLKAVETFTSPRAWAFASVGLHAYMSRFGGDANARRVRTQLSEKLVELFKNRPLDDWQWCEDTVTYANAKLPHALILAGQWIPDAQMYEKGIDALRWLLDKQTAADGHLSIIGNANWCKKEDKTSTFDQQPLEAMSLIDACAEAFRATGDIKWLEEGHRCLGWFMGRNDLNKQICVFNTGGCCDGLEATGVNANQGAESTLSWLISLLTMYEILGQKVLVAK
ncbi:MAG: glycosyltransferase family 4 protein [Spirochaetales bacterium]|jgi:glycosyltransferase involved in cell wall biosynthesis|nr:glycosyltransferase family 4 protein [Spirochaetales bacterium]